ncbi:tetratricopeptide repeat protein [Streptosporangium sp. NPDC049304]|uniref:tetratricopeptide repeat protein n=1 Tax=Streptosporangium sp. NPDC049304 TaxID=3154830 RepID=UPI003419CC24
MTSQVDARVQALAERARMLVMLRRGPDAEREARAALAEDPQNPAAHLMLALALFLQKDLDEALVEANRGTGLIPDHWFGHWVAGLILNKTGREREALGAFQNALARGPDEPLIYELLARTHFNLREFPAAAGAAGHGLRLAPEDGGLAQIMGIALAELGDADGAREHASRAIRLAPESADAHRAYGLVMMTTGDHRAAAGAFRETLRLAPEYEEGRNLLLEALKQRNPLRRLDGWLASLRLLTRRRILLWLALCLLVPWFVYMVLITLATWVNWVGQAVTTLVLHRDLRDRQLFDTAEVWAARISAGLFCCGIVLLVSAAVARSPGTVMAGVAVLGLITPVQETARLSGVRRHVFGGITGTLAATQAALIPMSYFGQSLVPVLLVFYACLASTWVANLLHPR